ncbi:hypothetical protein [Actinokineospora cianjurensis]|nr:hypothetical protein [Actinokineospora cianjurensis]
MRAGWRDRCGRAERLAYDFGSTPVKHRVYVWGGPGELDYTPVRYLGVA